MKTAALLAALLVPASSFAATETYEIDANHSAVVFHWNHFGFSNPMARLEKIEGQVMLDQFDLGRSRVSVRLPLDGLRSGNAKLDERLKSADFLDAAKYPALTFESTRVDHIGESTLKITGNLTVHGVTRPVTLNAKINKIGLFEVPGYKALAAGFDAETVLKRSDFGVSKFAPKVGDEIAVHITLHAEQPALITK